MLIGWVVFVVQCPICHGATKRVFQKLGYWICECRPCRHRVAEYAPSDRHVEQTFGLEYFSGGRDGYRDYLSESERLIQRGEAYADLVEPIIQRETSGASSEVPLRRILDVGAAAGFLLEGFHRKGWNGRGLEPCAAMADHANEHWKLPVAHGSLEELQSDESFDLVTMIQVVAHFRDLRKAFAQAAAHTANGGFWLIETWDYRSLSARAFGRHWHEYSPPTALQWFSRHSLARLAAQSGMQRIAQGRLAKRIQAGHAKSLLTHLATESWVARPAAQIARVIPDRWILPYPSEDLFWMVFRKTDEKATS